MAVLHASEFACKHLCFLRIMILFSTLSLVSVFSRYIATYIVGKVTDLDWHEQEEPIVFMVVVSF